MLFCCVVLPALVHIPWGHRASAAGFAEGAQAGFNFGLVQSALQVLAAQLPESDSRQSKVGCVACMMHGEFGNLQLTVSRFVPTCLRGAVGIDAMHTRPPIDH